MTDIPIKTESHNPAICCRHAECLLYHARQAFIEADALRDRASELDREGDQAMNRAYEIEPW